MTTIRVTALTSKGDTAILSYVNDCLNGKASQTVGMSKAQVFAAKKASKALPYTEEYFTNNSPFMIVVNIKRSFEDFNSILLPKIDIALKNIMEKYGAGLKDYIIEVE